MFIHGGGFKGGTKTKPEIVEMGQYFHQGLGFCFYRLSNRRGTM